MKKLIREVSSLAAIFIRDVITFIVVGFLASPTFALGPRVIGWGLNYSGQVSPPEDADNAVAVAAGGHHSLAIIRDGTVVGWGDNGVGQITIPGGLTDVEAIASGAFHNLALKKDGTVVAWGFNGFGQTTVPNGLSNVKAVAAGAYHSLALKSDGTVVGWGYNGFGEATPPLGLNNVVAIAAGFYHSVALKDDGTVVCWGENAFGQCAVPNSLSGVIAIAAGGYHTLALKADGTVVGWGYNGFGQITPPPQATNIIAIAAGAFHSLALRGDYKVISWGRNDVGQGETPLSVSSTNAVGIAAGFYHSIALMGTPPTISTVTALTDAFEDQPFNFNFTTLTSAADENDIDGDPVVFSYESTIAGTLTINGNPATAGQLIQPGDSLVWTPPANANGIIEAFVIRAFDGAAYSTNSVNVPIDVTPVNDAPVANPQSVTTDEDTAVNITLTGSDVENDPLTFAIVSGPTHGTLSGTPPNVTYTPAANFNGSDSFTFKVNDGTVDSAIATVNITVNSVNDAPVADSQNVTTDEDTAV
ncbi:MAG: tandem-95 repeat protein, partial [Verrucomicrobiia bacterium]